MVLGACNKWLDVHPKTQVKGDELFSNEQGFTDALAGIYASFGGNDLYGRNLTYLAPDLLAQYYETSETRDAFSHHQLAAYNYENAAVKAYLKQIWSSLYNLIANTNNLLKHIDQYNGRFVSVDPQAVKGEALALRAFMHFDLLRMYGPSYASGPDKTAIPYVPTVSLQPSPLLPVREVLDKIIADLKVAERLLASSDRGVAFFNYNAVRALLARVYLYKNDKENAGAYARDVINSRQYSFAPVATLTTPSNKNRTLMTEQIFALRDVTTLGENVKSYFIGTPSATISNADTYLANTLGMVNSIYETNISGTDYRYNYFWISLFDKMTPTRLWQEDALEKNTLSLLRIPEMYYIAAECATDRETGIAYLNEVRVNRGLTALPEDLNEAALQQEIYKEYRKEFVCEGQLWFYYKRLAMPQINGTSVAGSDAIYVFPLPDDEVLFGNRK